MSCGQNINYGLLKVHPKAASLWMIQFGLFDIILRCCRNLLQRMNTQRAANVIDFIKCTTRFPTLLLTHSLHIPEWEYRQSTIFCFCPKYLRLYLVKLASMTLWLAKVRFYIDLSSVREFAANTGAILFKSLFLWGHCSRFSDSWFCTNLSTMICQLCNLLK